MHHIKALTPIMIAILMGYIVGIRPEWTLAQDMAHMIANVFIFCLKWASLPLISLSILSTTSDMDHVKELLHLGGLILKYTLITTVIAASIGLILVISLHPFRSEFALIETQTMPNPGSGFFGLLLVLTVLLTLISSFLLLCFPSFSSQVAKPILTQFYQHFMRIIQWFLKAMPIAIFAFVTLFFQEISSTTLTSLGIYLSCVILANLLQALVILPLLLKLKNISSYRLFKNMLPALSVAFWSKSSGVALPIAIESAISRAKLSPRIAKFSLPLCTTINMNACAAFIIITVLFVSMSHGVTFSVGQLILWIFVATLAAIGNAGVPMGCFTLSSALLAYLNVPLHLMGWILPFYALIDMLESAINVWSDACVTAVVDQKVHNTVASERTAKKPCTLITG